MEFQKKLKVLTREEIWQDYCGFLDLRIEEYMYIQNRLMEEQLNIWKNSGLGKQLLGSRPCGSTAEFRANFPLTRYEDYADILLPRRTQMLPDDPVIWIKTTWEGGLRPEKVAPYTTSMLDTYRRNVLAITMLASSRAKGDFHLERHDRILYGGAPLPYATGLIPSLLSDDIDLAWLPDSNENSELSFSQRIKKGFGMAFAGGVDYFLAIGSVASYISDNFSSASGGSKKHMKVSPRIAARYLAAKLRHKKDGLPMRPGDVFSLKGFVSTGTDAACYKDKLAADWGVVPIEIAAGTESTCLATETWEHQGMVFFPDACFYEFIPEEELQRELEQPGYCPRTHLMDSVQEGETYELVLSVFHGGAFMRYRIGDMYRCVYAAPNGSLPRFTFVDRVPNVIDIAGFTRITEASIHEVIQQSRLSIGDWVARKEFSSAKTPFLHMYLEIPEECCFTESVTRALLQEHLSMYFKYYDSDYNDLKKLLNMEPLQLTILKSGTIASYEKATGRKLIRINTPQLDMHAILARQTAAAVPARGGIV